MNKFIQLDVGTQWKDSYNWDIFQIGFHNDGTIFSFGITILGLWFDIEVWER